MQAVDGGKGGGEQILSVFEKRLTDNIEKLNFSKMLTPVNVKRIVEEADGYQPHLIAPEMGYRRLLMECLVLFKASSSQTARKFFAASSISITSQNVVYLQLS